MDSFSFKSNMNMTFNRKTSFFNQQRKERKLMAQEIETINFLVVVFFFLEKIVFLFFVVLNRLSSQHHRAVDAVARRTQPTASPNGKRSVLFCFVFCFFSLPFPSAFSRFWLRDLLDSFFPLFCLYPILVCFFFNGIGLDPFFKKLFLWRIFSHGLRLYFRASRPFLWRSFVSVSLSRHFRCFFSVCYVDSIDSESVPAVLLDCQSLPSCWFGFFLGFHLLCVGRRVVHRVLLSCLFCFSMIHTEFQQNLTVRPPAAHVAVPQESNQSLSTVTRLKAIACE